MRHVRQTILTKTTFAPAILLTLGMTRTTLYGQPRKVRVETAPATTKILSTTQPGMPIVWRDPGVVETLDFAGGPGGRERTPSIGLCLSKRNAG
ncbi:MAG: hypothetical protein ACREAM_27450 [Blastocatellia bacterium]